MKSFIKYGSNECLDRLTTTIRPFLTPSTIRGFTKQKIIRTISKQFNLEINEEKSVENWNVRRSLKLFSANFCPKKLIKIFTNSTLINWPNTHENFSLLEFEVLTFYPPRWVCLQELLVLNIFLRVEIENSGTLLDQQLEEKIRSEMCFFSLPVLYQVGAQFLGDLLSSCVIFRGAPTFLLPNKKSLEKIDLWSLK